LEKISLSAEFQPILALLTLPVSTPFYLQSEDYLKLSDKKQFKKVFLDQLLSGIQCGFYFPKDLEVDKKMLESLIDAVEACNFKDKKDLTRKNRLDWIETVYLLLILKSVEICKPRHIVFISKDGVDVGAVTMAAFYALIKMLDGKSKWKEGEKELFISMHFLPALMERERIVDLHRLNRTISSISVLAANIEVKGGKFEGINTIFSSNFLRGLKLLTEK
jgi:hypothetical protein